MTIISPHELKFLPRANFDKIPKVVHQTYKSRQEVPELWEQGVKSWENLALEKDNNFMYVFWDDDSIENFILTECNIYYKFWKSRKHLIQRIDLFRYFLLERFGGIYVDCDLGLNVSHSRFNLFFEYYQNFDVAISESESAGRFIGSNSSHSNAFMMSKPNQNFWKELFVEMKVSPRSNSKKILSSVFQHFEIINSYGPGLINDVMSTFANNPSIVSIPKQFTAPGFAWSKKPYFTKDSILTVLEGNSWCDVSSRFLLKLNKAYHYRDVFIVPIMLLLIVFVILLSIFLSFKRKR